jgi:hypothetical protein
MGSQALFTDQPDAHIHTENLATDIHRWLQENNFLLDYRPQPSLREFMKTAPYIHPMTSALSPLDMDNWDIFFDHIFEYNPHIDEARLHFMDRHSLRLFQIVKNVNDEYINILRTVSSAPPYFSQVPDASSDPLYYFQYNLYRTHWKIAPRDTLRLFSSYFPAISTTPSQARPKSV